MTKKILIGMLLAAGMAFAQSSSSPGSSDQQQPTSNPSSTDQQQPSTNPSSTDQQQPSTYPSSQDQSNQNPNANPSGGNQTSLKGCLKQAGSNWVLAADNGQSVNLSGDSSMLKPHDGH